MRVSANGFEWNTHYDDSHNVLAVLSGKKRFFLSHPKAYVKHRMFPQFHPHERQTQALKKGEHGNRSAGIEEIEVTILAGELLVIPEFWFHRTVSEGCTVMLTQWSSTGMEDHNVKAHRMLVKRVQNFHSGSTFARLMGIVHPLGITWVPA